MINVTAKSIVIFSLLVRSISRFTVMTLYSASDMPDGFPVGVQGTVRTNHLICLREVNVKAMKRFPCR
jgi:hypothetical protein